jgi:CheY-like chemotaxis protein
MLERQVSHMVRLIDDLLDVSRITSGKIQLQRQPSDLKELVNSAVDANRAVIEGAGLTLSVDIPSMPCVLDVDPIRFVQVLSNLLQNATKFTPRGGHIAINGSVDETASPPELTLCVVDTGIGIPGPMLPHIFDYFVQGTNAHVVTSGLGIGLGLAKQLIELHGGRITASSVGENQGCTFALVMPVLAWASLSASEPAQEAQAQGLDKRVLIIDDNVDAAETLAAVVSALGGVAQTAYDGRSGLEYVQTFRPDVILLDIGMPDMDGYDTCRHVRAVPIGQSIFIVAVTGWGQPQDRERALANGFDAHFTKPADPRVLAAILAEAPARPVNTERR